MSTAETKLEKNGLSQTGRTQPATMRKSRVSHFLEKYWVALCICLVAIACIRIISTYEALSLTIDEPFHLACAIEYLGNHSFTLDTENPPVARAVEAIGPYLEGLRPVERLSPRAEGVSILTYSGHFDRIVFLMRLGNLPFFLLACLIVTAWSWRSFGKPVAVLALALFTLLPTVLADAGFATTDTALGATVAAAFFSALLWAERPTVWRALLLGFCTAFAFLSKFTALSYVPFTIFLALLCYLAVRRPALRTLWELGRQRIATFVLAGATSLLLIWAAYGFSFGMVPPNHIAMPAPEFFRGVLDARAHNMYGHGSYLFGEYRGGGWWYYFPVALAVKMPIAFLILVVVGIVVCLKHRSNIAYLLPLAFSVGILVPPMFGQINIGIRHIEPIYMGLSIIAALGLAAMLNSSRFGIAPALAACALFLWMIVSVAIHHPDYLTYFNGFAGKHPEEILVDSNYDWGQDLKFLAKRLHQLGVDSFTIGSLDGCVGHSDCLEAWYGLPEVKDLDDYHPTPGWTVVSPTYARAYRIQVGHPVEPKPWYEKMPPTEKVGALDLFYIPPDNKPSSPSASAPAPARP